MEVMQYLQYIRINAEKIVSIEEVRSLEGLRNITMSVGDVTDFSPLGEKLKLERLHINGGAGSLNFLSSLVNLEILYLIGNKFNSIPDLSKLKEIKTIELSRTAIKKITGLENLSNLKYLTLNNNKNLTKIEGLDGLISLRDLKLKGSAIKKMENLNLPRLESLDLSKTDITKMENMGEMPELYDLAIHDTKIKKIEGYLDAPKLTDVGIEYSGEFYENNKEAIEFLGKRKKDTYSFLLD
jgi:Leucine-rich repeat (LRR) protein